MADVKPTSFFGLFDDGYEATDDKGHTGAATSKDDTKLALEEAQSRDAAKVEIAGLTRIRNVTPKEDDAAEDATEEDAEEAKKASDAEASDKEEESKAEAEDKGEDQGEKEDSGDAKDAESENGNDSDGDEDGDESDAADKDE